MDRGSFQPITPGGLQRVQPYRDELFEILQLNKQQFVIGRRLDPGIELELGRSMPGA